MERTLTGSITPEEWAEGWRFCCEFDGMLLNCKDAENPEAAICKCQGEPYPRSNIPPRYEFPPKDSQ